MRFLLTASLFLIVICCPGARADTEVRTTDDGRYISINSGNGGLNISLSLLKNAMATAVERHFQHGKMADSREQRKMVEGMVARVASSLGTSPIGFSGPPETRSGSVVSVGAFSLNIFPVLRAIRVYFDQGLIRPGIERRIEEALANGFLSSLDRYSSYWNKIDADMRMANREGYTKSIGVVFCIYDGVIVVYKTLPGSPAEKVGLQFRDRIVEIDGLDTKNDSDIDLNRKLWGEPGTVVQLRVFRPKIDCSLAFSIIRVRTEIKSVAFSIFKREGNSFGLLKIDGFNENTDEQYDSFVSVFVENKPRFVVIDLRDNFGGYIHIVQEIVGRILGAGRVTLIEEHPSGRRVTKYARAPYKGGLSGYLGMSDIKMICLVGGSTASGGEALASAIRDAGIFLVGERTFGKGIALLPTEDASGDGYYYTAEFKWLTSRGVCIEGIGLSPDVYERNAKREMYDVVLERAVEELLKK